jgi:ArsR family metal-binding transcriptional regulator
MPSAMTVQCHAHLDQEISEALPYLNAVLGGFEYTREPPSVSFKAHGKLITVSGDMIAVNALKDEAEAEKIVNWIRREVNTAWENRENIDCEMAIPDRSNCPYIVRSWTLDVRGSIVFAYRP